MAEVVTVNPRSGCSCDGSIDYRGEQFSSIFVALKILAFIVIVLSITEFGVGGAAANVVIGQLGGAWWGGILSVLAGLLAFVAYNRGYIIAALVIGSVAILLAISAAYVETLVLAVLLNITACTSQSSSKALPQDYGSESGYKDSRACITRAGTKVIPDRCYCSKKSTFFISAYSYCEEYALTSSATASGMNCGSLFTSYPSLLFGSRVINILIIVFTILMLTVSCVISRKGRLIIVETPFVGVEGNGC